MGNQKQSHNHWPLHSQVSIGACQRLFESSVPVLNLLTVLLALPLLSSCSDVLKDAAEAPDIVVSSLVQERTDAMDSDMVSPVEDPVGIGGLIVRYPSEQHISTASAPRPPRQGQEKLRHFSFSSGIDKQTDTSAGQAEEKAVLVGEPTLKAGNETDAADFKSVGEPEDIQSDERTNKDHVGSFLSMSSSQSSSQSTETEEEHGFKWSHIAASVSSSKKSIKKAAVPEVPSPRVSSREISERISRRITSGNFQFSSVAPGQVQSKESKSLSRVVTEEPQAKNSKQVAVDTRDNEQSQGLVSDSNNARAMLARVESTDSKSKVSIGFLSLFLIIAVMVVVLLLILMARMERGVSYGHSFDGKAKRR